MNEIFSKLPTFAADYSGALGVFYELGGIHIICDASGCHGSSLILDEPRMYSGFAQVYSASIREKDVVLGIDRKLKRQVKETYRTMGGKYIVLLGTPGPAVIGTDFDGIGRELEKELEIPVFAIDSNGLGFYDEGQEKAYQALLEYSIKKNPGEKAEGPDVNVIGATPLDMWDLNQIKDCIQFLKDCGARNPAVWGSNGKLEQIAGACHAKLNIAVSVSAVPTVKKMEKLFGIPYLLGFPIGVSQTEEWRYTVSELLGGSEGPYIGQKEKTQKEGKRALVVGEQLFANSLREMLRREFDYETVEVVSYFRMYSELMEENDKKLVWESEWSDLLQERAPYDLIAGDPLFLAMLPYRPRHVLSLPHTAVSSRAFWDQSPNLFGEKATEYIGRIEQE